VSHSTEPSPEDIREALRKSTQNIEDAHQQRVQAVAQARAAGVPLTEICALAGISKPTAIRYTRAAGEVTA
jgi:hypothetical protein